MPRPTTEKITDASQRPAQGPSVARQVNARPVDAPAVSVGDDGMSSFLQGLSQFNNGIDAYVQAKADQDVQKGKASARAGEALPVDPSENFKMGYMVLDGQVKGHKDAEALYGEYMSGGFDRDGGDLEKWLEEKWAKNAGGMADPHAAAGYRSAMGAVFNQIREAQGQYQRQRVIERAESNTMSQIDRVMKSAIDKGALPSDELLDGLRGELSKYGLVPSNARWNEMLFTVANTYGRKGNFAIFEMFKKPRPDGTPGMYSIPAWREKIDLAESQAQSQFVATQARAQAALKLQRETRQEEAMYGVLKLVHDNDIEGAQQAWRGLVASGLFTRADDLHKAQTALFSFSKREARRDQEITEVSLLTGVYDGSVRDSDILAADITPEQMRRLLSERAALRGRIRAEAAAARAADAAIDAAGTRLFRAPEYSSGRKMIAQATNRQVDALTRAIPGPMLQNFRELAATAQFEFTSRVRELDPQSDVSQVNKIANEIRERAAARMKEIEEGLKASDSASLLYPSMTAAYKAYREGRLSFDQLSAHTRHYGQQAKQPPKPTQ